MQQESFLKCEYTLSLTEVSNGINMMAQQAWQREAVGHVAFGTVGYLWQTICLAKSWPRQPITYLIHTIRLVLSVSHAAE